MTLLYLGTAMGIGLNFHYCFGRVASVKLYESKPDCKLIKRNELPDCCKSKQLTVKVKDSHEFTKAGYSAIVMAVVKPATRYADLKPALSSRQLQVPVYRGPPGVPASACPVFIKNCNFRI
ncbi:hypothetical protein GCM10027037_28640 [Mucilaginibacter koreensis]